MLIAWTAGVGHVFGIINHPAEVPQKYIANEGVGFLSGLLLCDSSSVQTNTQDVETGLVYL